MSQRPTTKSTLAVILTVLALAVLPLAPAAEAKESGHDLWQQAYDAYHEHRYDEAVTAFEAAAEAGYRPAVAIYNAACSHALAGQADEALATLERAVELGLDRPELIAEDSDLDSLRPNPRFQALVDDAFERAGEHRNPRDHYPYRRAMERLESLRQKDSGDPQDWYDVGTRLLMLRQLDLAAEALDQAARLETEEPAVAFYNLACAYALDGREGQALDALERAIEAGYSDPDHMQEDPDLRSLRENAEFDRLVDLADALDFDRYRSRWWRQRGPGSWRDNQNMYSEDFWIPAIDFYREFTDEHSNLGAGWFNLGLALHYSRRFDESIQAFQRAADFGFRPAASTYNVACGYSMLNRPEPAFVALEEAVDLGFEGRDLRDDDDLDNLLTDPRFRELRQRLQRQRKS